MSTAPSLPTREELDALPAHQLPTAAAAYLEGLAHVFRRMGEATSTAEDGDKLLTSREVAEALDVSLDWMSRHGSRLPFRRKIGPRLIRYSQHGLQRYLASRRG